MTIQSNDALKAWIAKGGHPKFVFFWGHQKAKSGISHSCFSQWYGAPFEDDGMQFKTAEHYMMYHKAMLFGCPEIGQQILASAHPNEAKQLGRKVTGFDEAIWNEKRFEIVVSANRLKFSQNPELKAFLLGTGKRILVEASPVDKIWGIGLAADHELAPIPAKWKGLNLLGYALMVVRDELCDEASFTK
ncbi:NADAR family protein [Vibrio quintilis]|uniref:Swarming motility protein YbiA n=1 Tax=Vibrio quintilis TaxID=1117707 RepID=A0A1M7YXX5_9VIBR|nr:NADAR family protein [Vibrio quintilis]SHO57539.1 Swarming motility protein YbiA [Vibrio quintilis]